MSDFRLTPFEMSVLMHYLNENGEPFESRATESLLRETHCNLAHYGLIYTTTGGARWAIADKGKAWMEMALSTPLPVQKWTRP